MEEQKRLLRMELHEGCFGPLELCDAIRHEGEIWLVPDWIRSPRGRSAKPLRMIPLSKFPHKVFRQTPEAFADYGIDGVVPKGLFDLHISDILVGGFGVRERPNLRVHIGQLQLAW